MAAVSFDAIMKLLFRSFSAWLALTENLKVAEISLSVS